MVRLLVFSGLAFVLIGVALIGLGLILKRGGLPGDIMIRKEGFLLYIPITSAIILSLALSGFAWLMALLFRKT